MAHRQWVFTIPKALRKLFYRDRRLLGELAQCVASAILEFFAAVFPDKGCRPGIIASTQTFGDLFIWHSHIHCLVTDGVFDPADQGKMAVFSHFSVVFKKTAPLEPKL